MSAAGQSEEWIWRTGLGGPWRVDTWRTGQKYQGSLASSHAAAGCVQGARAGMRHGHPPSAV